MAFLVYFGGTAVQIRRRFFYIQIIPFSPTLASLFCLKICRIFVFDCWKVPTVLLCVLVDVLLIEKGYFGHDKSGSLQKTFFLLLYNSHNIKQRCRPKCVVVDWLGVYDDFAFDRLGLSSCLSSCLSSYLSSAKVLRCLILGGNILENIHEMWVVFGCCLLFVRQLV